MMKKIFTGLLLVTLQLGVLGQTETPPTPGAPRAVKFPATSTVKLANGLTVATMTRSSLPLVTVQFVVACGGNCEGSQKAGLAGMTAEMLLKGTRTRSAAKIAEDIEFLGGSIESGANWNHSRVVLTVTSDKIDQAMAILADVVRNPTFDEKEFELLKSQKMDGLAANFGQAGFLAGFVSSSLSFGEHPIGGTPATLSAATKQDAIEFRNKFYQPFASRLVFSGDITAARARALGQRFFSAWKGREQEVRKGTGVYYDARDMTVKPVVQRIVVVDLPDSGQASVGFNTVVSESRTKFTPSVTSNDAFFQAMVLNSVLGGGYSSRLNQEIRIKRGLSYGAGSSFVWRDSQANFSARTQTKNESAAQVAELIVAEINKLREEQVTAAELAPRKLVLTGDFGRELETTAGSAEVMTSLLGFSLPLTEINSYFDQINAIGPAQIMSFAKENLHSGDLVIVGDYKVFKDDLAKRFPTLKPEVMPAASLAEKK